MSTPTPAGQMPTRQQLDEIDALLRRMLSLPSLTGEAAPSPPPPPVSMSFPAPTVREVPPAHPPVANDPVVHSWRVEWPQPPAAQPAAPPSVVAWGAPVSVPAELAARAAMAPAQPAVSPPYAAAVAPPGAPAQAPVPLATAAHEPVRLGLALLVVLNAIFNCLTYLLGPLGTWLRGPGRGVLGWVGIAMIVAAAVWAIGNWQGYEWPHLDLSRIGLSR